MELRQMIPKFSGKTAGIATFRVKRHLRPEIFAKLKDPSSGQLRESPGDHEGRIENRTPK